MLRNDTNEKHDAQDATVPTIKKSQLTQFVIMTAIEECFRNVGLTENTIAKVWMDIIKDKNAKNSDKLRATENLVALLGVKAKQNTSIEVDGDISNIFTKFSERKK